MKPGFNLGGLIDMERERLGAREFAKVMGVTPQALSHWKLGHHTPPERLLKYFGLKKTKDGRYVSNER